VRLRTIHDLDAAAIRLNIVCKVVLDPLCEDGKLRSIIVERIAREQLERDSTTVDTLTRPEDDNCYEFLLGNYTTIRRFLPLLLRTVQFEAAKACQPALKAIEFLRDIEGNSKPAIVRSATRSAESSMAETGDSARRSLGSPVLHLLCARKTAGWIGPARHLCESQ
jgi:hypothetical protein